jgi:hypothetical protein
MFKSKHSGWTYDLKRTPFGGGGGIGNAFGLGDALASIDPGPAIGKGLAEVDTTVNREIPGGWALPAIITAAVLAPELAPELFALTEGTEGALTTDAILNSSGFVPTAGNSFVIDPALAYTTAAGGASALTATPGADAILGSSTNIANLTPPGAGNFGSIVAPSANAVTNGAGLTGAMGAGTMVGDGTLGTTIGQSYMSAGPGQFALNASGSAIPAGASGIAGTTPSGMSASDIFDNAKKAKNLSDLLKQGATSGLSQSLGKLAQGANPQGQELGAIVRGNQNPFTYTQQQPIQNAKPLDIASLANLLKQG